MSDKAYEVRTNRDSGELYIIVDLDDESVRAEAERMMMLSGESATEEDIASIADQKIMEAAKSVDGAFDPETPATLVVDSNLPTTVADMRVS